MGENVDFKLYTWLSGNASKAVSVLGGSATPSLSLKDITALSSDPEATSKAFDCSSVPLGLASPQGKVELREVLASTYDHGLSKITSDNIVVANGTTGANHIVYRALLKPGDHIIAQYPTYGPLIEEPRHIGCDISYLRLNPSNSWQPDPDELQGLIKPGVTKMLILNNPSNPTGTFFTRETQRELIKIAQEHNLIIHCDEIFRPLFHSEDLKAPTPPSMNEHLDVFPDYHNIVTTSSTSKAYGLSGLRIGWIITRSSTLMAKFMHMRLYSMQALSIPDEHFATEILGPRCRAAILSKHLTLARENIDTIQAFVSRNKDVVEWVRPTAGAVAFVKFRDAKTGEPVDDVLFCQRLLDEKRVILSPASSCFEIGQGGEGGEFKGRVRLHFTATREAVEKGIQLIEEFCEEERKKG